MPTYEPRAAAVRLESGAGAGDFAYLDFGPAARTVDAVFLHANGFNARTYRTILAPLAADRRILALDLRGHGRTRAPIAPEGRPDWLDLRADLMAFLDARVPGSAVLAGHSMGGTLSLLAAAAAPEKARALALFDPVISGPAGADAGDARDSSLVAGAVRRRRAFDSREAAIAAYRGRGAFATWPDPVLIDYVKDGFRDLPEGGIELACTPEWEASNFLAHENDGLAAIAATRCPICILRAEIGSTCRIEDQIDALTASGRIRIETVPGTTHFLPMERPELVRATLSALME
jgi:pimeloyl-ACP methyl ester carboxylesterase